MPRAVHKVSILGMELPIPHWSISGIGILVLLGIAAVIYKQVIEVPPDIVSAKEVNERLASEIEEYGIHAMEEPTKHELLEDADGALAIRVFPDHCVLIQRKTSRGMRTKLIPDLAKEPIRTTQESELKEPVLASHESEPTVPTVNGGPWLRGRIIDIDTDASGQITAGTVVMEEASEADLIRSGWRSTAQSACNRGCLNPHPGAFKWWYGARRGDWVEVVRQWPEGCQHVQMMHPPSGTWDTNPDGTPRVRWVCCVH